LSCPRSQARISRYNSLRPNRPPAGVPQLQGTAGWAPPQPKTLATLQSGSPNHFTVTVKHPVRKSFVGLVRSSTSRNITSNWVPSRIVGASKLMWTDPAPPSEVWSMTSGPVAGKGKVTKFGAGGPHGAAPAARWQTPAGRLPRRPRCRLRQVQKRRSVRG
jgi:hypothetical protein